MQPTSELNIFITAAALIIFILSTFLIVFFSQFRRRQNELLLKNQLDEEKYKNELLQSEIEANKKLEKERERISLDIHDDLGASLSAIKLKAEFIQGQSDNKEIKTTLAEIVDNTREISYNMREMMWSLSGENDSLESFVIYAKNYVHQFFENSGIQPLLSIPIIIDNQSMNGYVRRNLFLVIKEACHNILKHSGATEMEFKVEVVAHSLQISITDKGIGIHTENKKGNGLYSMNKRMVSIHGKLEFISQEIGTGIQLTIPL
jgi:two-component system, NarL family, sensor histidine kinase DesK